MTKTTLKTIMDEDNIKNLHLFCIEMRILWRAFWGKNYLEYPTQPLPSQRENWIYNKLNSKGYKVQWSSSQPMYMRIDWR